jgi:hypothetical protein
VSTSITSRRTFILSEVCSDTQAVLAYVKGAVEDVHGKSPNLQRYMVFHGVSTNCLQLPTMSVLLAGAKRRLREHDICQAYSEKRRGA